MIIDEWRSAFIKGTSIDGQAWKPRCESGKDQALLLVMILYVTETGW